MRSTWRRYTYIDKLSLTHLLSAITHSLIHSLQVLQQKQKKGADGGMDLNPFFTRMIWQEMLEAVDHIHQHHVVHGELSLTVMGTEHFAMTLFSYLMIIIDTPVLIKVNN